MFEGMGRTRGRRTAAALMVAATLGVATAADDDRSAVAPRNEWCAEGGVPARTRASATPVIDGPVEIAWEHVPSSGTVVGEPIVFQRWACIEEDRSRGRALVFLDVFDGTKIGEVSFRDASASLRPSQSGGTLVARVGSNEWRTYVVRDGKVVTDTKHKTEERIDDLLAVWDPTAGTRVLVQSPDGLSLRDVGTGESLWSFSGEGPIRGQIAMRSGVVYCVTDGGRAHIEAVDAWSGRSRGKIALGYDPSLGESDFQAAIVQAFTSRVLITNVLTEKQRGTIQRLVYLVTAQTTGATFPLMDDVGLLTSPGLFTAAGDSWLAVLEDTEHKGLRLCRSSTEGKFSILSRSKTDGLLGDARYPALGAGTTLLGRFAAAGTELGVRWVAPLPLGARTVPARGRVLFAYPERVVALRTRQNEGPKVRLLRVPSGEFLGSVVTERGDVLEGPIVVDGEARTVGIKGAEPVSIDETSLVMTRKGGVVALRTGAAVEDALLTLSRAKRGAALAKLAVEAAKARDIDLIALLLAHATALEGPAAPLKLAAGKRKGIARLKDPRPDAKIAAEVRAKAEPLLAGDDATLSDVYRGLPEGTEPEVRIDLLRLIARSGAASEEFRADVLALLPESLRPTGAFDCSAWLAVADAVQTTQVDIVPAPTADTPELTPGERLLGALTHTWRKDLIGVRSDQLMVVAPLESPGALGRCLSVGELVCSRLEEVFAKGERDRSSRFPIMILVYPTEEAYRERARDRGLGSHVSEYSAGHYSPGEELSHMYLPDDEDAFRAMMPTFAHELTHQWIEERCPLFSAAELKGSSESGYWIVEGFAEMVEERAFDIRARTWQFDPYAKSLAGVVALSDQKALIPWGTYFGLGYAEFSKLDKEHKIPVPGGRELARGGLLSETNVFYTQGAATCHYLFEAENGALRPKLLEYLRLQYTGKPPVVKDHFGISAAELGRKVEEWARSQRAK